MENITPPPHARTGKIFAGLLIIAVGTIFLLKNMGYIMPDWLQTKGLLLTVLGLFIGVRNNFRNAVGPVLILIGGFVMAREYYHLDDVEKYFWPCIIILFGIWMIFGKSRPKRWGGGRFRQRYENPKVADFVQKDIPVNPGHDADFFQAATEDDYLDTVCVFGGSKKIILSKNFKGGEIITFLGGSELNLSQADIQGRAVLDVTQVLGGTKLIVPAHWDIKTDMVAVFGGIDDKRMLQPGTINPDKVLVIKGTSVFGGIDIRTY